MGHQEHRERAPSQVGFGLVTVSTSRSLAEDGSGSLMAELAQTAGHRVIQRQRVQDNEHQIAQCLRGFLDDPALQVAVFSGGTGITHQDLTIEALQPLVATWLPGFGELFRALSFAEIGPAAMLSRAAAGVCNRGDGRRLFVIALPGSPAAVRLAWERLILPEIGHVIFELNR